MVTILDVITVVKPSDIDLRYHSVEEEIGAEMIAYNDVGLTICGVVKLVCSRPRLAFARALSLFEEPLMQCSLHAGFLVTMCKNTIIPVLHPINASGPDDHGALLKLGANCSIGGRGFGYEPDEDGTPVRIHHVGNVTIGRHVELGSNVTIDRAVTGSTEIGDNVKTDDHVHIGHGAKVGKNTLLAAGVILSGSVVIGENCFLGAGVMVKQKVKIGNNVKVGIGAVVLKDIPDGETWVGNPARKLEKAEIMPASHHEENREWHKDAGQ